MVAEMDIVRKSGAWYSYNNERLGSRENAKDFLVQNLDICEEIKN